MLNTWLRHVKWPHWGQVHVTRFAGTCHCRLSLRERMHSFLTPFAERKATMNPAGIDVRFSNCNLVLNHASIGSCCRAWSALSHHVAVKLPITRRFFARKLAEVRSKGGTGLAVNARADWRALPQECGRRSAWGSPACPRSYRYSLPSWTASRITTGFVETQDELQLDCAHSPLDSTSRLVFQLSKKLMPRPIKADNPCTLDASETTRCQDCGSR
jgi:hypothetical protein